MTNLLRLAPGGASDWTTPHSDGQLVQP